MTRQSVPQTSLSLIMSSTLTPVSTSLTKCHINSPEVHVFKNKKKNQPAMYEDGPLDQYTGLRREPKSAGNIAVPLTDGQKRAEVWKNDMAAARKNAKSWQTGGRLGLRGLLLI